MIDEAILRRVHELQRRTKRGPSAPPYDALDEHQRGRHAELVTRALAGYHRGMAREVAIT